MRNSEFLAALYGVLGENHTYGWTTAFASDPNKANPTVWGGNSYLGTDNEKAIIDQRQEDNTFYCVAVLKSEGGKRLRNKETFSRLAVLLADDIDPNELNAMPSFVVQTSPHKSQVGVLIDPDDEDARNLPLIDAILQRMAADGLYTGDPSGNSATRYARLPVGSNTKARDEGPFAHQLLKAKMGFYSLRDACATFGLDLDDIRQSAGKARLESDIKTSSGDSSELYKALINPDLTQRVYHDALLKLSSSMVASGMHRGAVVNHLRSIMNASRPTVPGLEMDRWLARTGSELVRMVESAGKFAPDDQGAPTPPAKLIMSMEQLKTATASVDWLVKTYIPENAIMCLFGASSTFKSFVALSSALHIASGMEWLGQRTKQGPVLYCAAEGGAGIYRRAAAWAKMHLDGAEFVPNFNVVTIPVNLTAKDEMAALRMEIAEMAEPPVLIVLDTLAQLYGGGDENDSAKISEFCRAVGQNLRAPFGATVMIIHHTGYGVDAANRPRGSSALPAAMDAMLSIVRPDSEALTCKMTVVKMKDSEHPAHPTYFDMESIDLGVDQHGERQTSLVAKHSDQARKAADALRSGKYSSLIMKMLDAGLPVTTNEMRMESMPMSGNNTDNARRAITRTLKLLRDAKKIYEKSPDVWMIER